MSGGLIRSLLNAAKYRYNEIQSSRIPQYRISTESMKDLWKSPFMD